MFKIDLTKWEKTALITIIDNGTYKGADLEPLLALKNKIKTSVETPDGDSNSNNDSN